MKEIYDNAIVCGRFQPFHNDHLHYILSSLAKCRFLWIGISKPLRSLDDTSSSHREEASSNPYTYIQRLQMIRNSLTECGISADCYAIIPFDFENQPLLAECDPPSPIVFMTITDQWSIQKQQKIEKLGKKVEVLFDKQNPQITGTRIRKLIQEGNVSWFRMVPPAVAKIVENVKIDG